LNFLMQLKLKPPHRDIRLILERVKMQTCTHCLTNHPQTHQYATKDGLHAVCAGCLDGMLAVLPRHVSPTIPDLTPYSL
jgi:hypothetical protein